MVPKEMGRSGTRPGLGGGVQPAPEVLPAVAAAPAVDSQFGPPAVALPSAPPVAPVSENCLAVSTGVEVGSTGGIHELLSFTFYPSVTDTTSAH